MEQIWPNNYTVVWPDDWFEKERNEWTLVLRANYEDHTDYIFLAKWMWEDFLSFDDYWKEVTFQWKIYPVDWAAGSHYYNADYVEQLEIVNAD